MEPFFGMRYTNFHNTIDGANSYENNMVGGQLDPHLYKWNGPWLLSCEMRGFALENFQFFDTGGADSDDVREFVWGGELHL